MCVCHLFKWLSIHPHFATCRYLKRNKRKMFQLQLTDKDASVAAEEKEPPSAA
jgi:hypothetical protein